MYCESRRQLRPRHRLRMQRMWVRHEWTSVGFGSSRPIRVVFPITLCAGPQSGLPMRRRRPCRHGCPQRCRTSALFLRTHGGRTRVLATGSGAIGLACRRRLPMAFGQLSMAALHVEAELPVLTQVQSLTGWRREFCIELLGRGEARIFMRAVEVSSFKATELKRAILFHRVDPRFAEIAGCVASLRLELERLAGTAQRIKPDKDNLFATVTYERQAGERVRQGLDPWL